MQFVTALSFVVSADSLSLSLAAAVLSCPLGSSLASMMGVPGFSLGFVAVIASAFASLAASMPHARDAEAVKHAPFEGSNSTRNGENWL